MPGAIIVGMLVHVDLSENVLYTYLVTILQIGKHHEINPNQSSMLPSFYIPRPFSWLHLH